MPYVPRPTTTVSCAHCGTHFASRNLRRKYCSNSCNVLASYARTGRRAESQATKADLEKALVEMRDLVRQIKQDQLKKKMLALKTRLEASEE
jgi:endogenous inhibitor of DNA gyrase (YacG/DUF329 family)